MNGITIFNKGKQSEFKHLKPFLFLCLYVYQLYGEGKIHF